MQECPVCLESLDNNTFNTLPCSHQICKKCFPRLRIPICPLCRNPFGETRSDDYDNEPIIVIEIDYDILDFLSPRQRRRQRNRHSHNHRMRPRHITPIQPLSIININDTLMNDSIIDNRTILHENTRKKLPEHKRHKRNQKKRNFISNRWNELRTQQNLI